MKSKSYAFFYHFLASCSFIHDVFSFINAVANRQMTSWSRYHEKKLFKLQLCVCNLELEASHATRVLFIFHYRKIHKWISGWKYRSLLHLWCEMKSTIRFVFAFMTFLFVFMHFSWSYEKHFLNATKKVSLFFIWSLRNQNQRMRSCATLNKNESWNNVG